MSVAVVIIVKDKNGRLPQAKWLALLSEIKGAIASESTVSAVHGYAYGPMDKPPYASFSLECSSPGPVWAKVRMVAGRYRHGHGVAVVVGPLESALGRAA